MLHAQKLESLGVLAGGIAHDFNNLLVGVLGNADLALMELDGSSAAVEHLAMIVTAANRASELTKQMLAYSGKGKFVVEPVHVSELVEEMARLMAVSISKKVKLHREFGENVPAVEADSSQLRQVVMNLITNASEAVGDAIGTITIRTGVAGAGHRFHDAASGYSRTIEAPHVFIEVSDTGCGMDPETESKLFEPFFTTKFTGRGLGLAAALGIVRSHGGALEIESHPGRGSRFRVLFPAALPVQTAAGSERSEDSAPWRGSGTVLLVDDDEGVRAFGVAVLQRCGLRVLTASDGRDALELYARRSGEIDVVVLDRTLPGTAGDDVHGEMRRIRPDARIVLMSGYADRPSARPGSASAAGFLRKPFTHEALVREVRTALDPARLSPA